MAWTLRSSAIDVGSGRRVVVTPTIAVAIGTNSFIVHKVLTSTDVGVTWVSESIPVGWMGTGICWSPSLGVFVIAGYDFPDGPILTSPNGTTWTQESTPWDGTTGQLVDVTWAESLGLFVATGGGGPSLECALTSNDGGSTWVASTFPAGWVDGNSVAWSESLGVLVVAGTTSTGTMLATSTDGATWSNGTTPVDGLPSGFGWRVRWCPNNGVFICAIYPPTVPSNIAVFWSSDGYTWTRSVMPGPPVSVVPSDVCEVNDVIVMTGTYPGRNMYVSCDAGRTFVLAWSIPPPFENTFGLGYDSTFGTMILMGRTDPPAEAIATGPPPASYPREPVYQRIYGWHIDIDDNGLEVLRIDTSPQGFSA